MKGDGTDRLGGRTGGGRDSGEAVFRGEKVIGHSHGGWLNLLGMPQRGGGARRSEFSSLT